MGSKSNTMDIDFNSIPKKLVKRSDNLPSNLSQNTNNKQTLDDVAESKSNESNANDTTNNQEIPPSVPKTVLATIVSSVKDFDASCALSFDDDIPMEVDWRSGKLVVSQESFKWAFNDFIEDKNNKSACLCHYDTLHRINGEDKYISGKRWAKLEAQLTPFSKVPGKILIHVPITMALFCKDCDILSMLSVVAKKKLNKLKQDTDDLKNPPSTKSSKQHKKADMKELHKMAFLNQLGGSTNFATLMHNNDSDGVLFDGKNATTMDYPKNNNGVMQFLQAQAQAQAGHGKSKKQAKPANPSPVQQQSLQWALLQSKLDHLVQENKKLRSRMERRGKSPSPQSRSRSRSRNRDSD